MTLETFDDDDGGNSSGSSDTSSSIIELLLLLLPLLSSSMLSPSDVDSSPNFKGINRMGWVENALLQGRVARQDLSITHSNDKYCLLVLSLS
jgi:hypothetical protein